jgi:hypothetical protein
MIRLHLRSAISAILPLVAISAHAAWTVKIIKVPDSRVAQITHGDGVQQVGVINVRGKQHGGIWSGTSESWVPLTPAGADGSYVSVLTGSRQYGSLIFGIRMQGGYWTGTADSWVSLHPPGTDSSTVLDVQENLVLMHGRFARAWDFGPILKDLITGQMVSLLPYGVQDAIAYRMHNGKQVGVTEELVAGYRSQAALWSGTSESYVNLHPAGAHTSELRGIWGKQQVGWVKDSRWVSRAGLWTGTAESFVSLHPAGYESSTASDVWNGFQIGSAYRDKIHRAGVWRGKASSWVDLHAYVTGYTLTRANRIWSDGKTVFIGGWGINSFTKSPDALLWSRPLK